MGIFELLTVALTMVCLLSATVVFGYAWYRFLTRNRWRAERAMRPLLAELTRLRDPQGKGLIRGTPARTTVMIGDTVIEIRVVYTPHNRHRTYASGTVATRVELTAPRLAPVPNFTIRFDHPDEPVEHGQALVGALPGLPHGYVLNATDPSVVDVMWTPAVREVAIFAAGWRIQGIGASLLARRGDVPASAERLDGLLTLLTALAEPRAAAQRVAR